MALQLENLDERTRKLMLGELQNDIAQNKLYISDRLSENGKKDYTNLLKEAVEKHDEQWLAESLRSEGRLNEVVPSRSAKSGFSKMPVNAPDMLAEGEFNRFYIRGVCCRAIEDSIPKVEVYRAKAVSNPRPESVAKIGQLIDAKELLEDIQAHPGVEPKLGIPSPNSGLSVRLPKRPTENEESGIAE
jgi:hypothetical protein